MGVGLTVVRASTHPTLCFLLYIEGEGFVGEWIAQDDAILKKKCACGVVLHLSHVFKPNQRPQTFEIAFV